MRALRTIFAACVLGAALPAWAGDALRVHMLSGSKEYQSEESLKRWAVHLESSYGVACTFSWGTDKCTEVDGLENLATTDVLVVFCRRWELSGEQARAIQDFIESGHPIVGIRTASHAFEFLKSFDKEVLGGDYSGHGPGDQSVTVRLSQVNAQHPVLHDVSGWNRTGKPYHNPAIADDALVLAYAREQDGETPLAWVRTVDESQRVFYTSLGLPADFRNPSFVRMLDNALFWAADVER